MRAKGIYTFYFPFLGLRIRLSGIKAFSRIVLVIEFPQRLMTAFSGYVDGGTMRLILRCLTLKYCAI